MGSIVAGVASVYGDFSFTLTLVKMTRTLLGVIATVQGSGAM